MSFISVDFILFLIVLVPVYWLLFNKSAFLQNIILCLASLFFYSWQSFNFIGVAISSIVVNFFLAKKIAYNKSRAGKELGLWLGILLNVIPLVFFKYIEAISDHSNSLDSIIGVDSFVWPLGISFFTFQNLAYLIDVYNEEIEPADDLLTFSLFVIFFPKVVAGPIERAQHFLPQVLIKREFNYNTAVDGLRQILWGSFVKIVIANNCASITEPIFANYQNLSGSTLLMGAFFYLFQIYCDFSAYSNMAIGISKLFGIKLTRNFDRPFFATNIADYWRRWHISLSSWMMQYVFNPLSFALRRYNKAGLMIAVVITFILVGLWHGTKFTFLVFGLLHGLYFIPVVLSGKNSINRIKSIRLLSVIGRRAKRVGLFWVIMLTCVIFGSDSLGAAFGYLKTIFSYSIFDKISISIPNGSLKIIATFFFISFLLYMEWRQKGREHELQLENVATPFFRKSIYYFLILLIALFGSIQNMKFLYAQF